MIERHAGKVRTDDANSDFAFRERGGSLRRGLCCAKRSEREARFQVHRAAERHEPRIVAAGCEQGRAVRHAAFGDGDRHGEAAQIKQVHEVRVGAKIGIEPYRFGFEFGERIGARHGRNHQGIDRHHDAARFGAKLLHPVEGTEGIDRIELETALDDCSRDRMRFIRVLCDEFADRRRPLRDPGAFVEQARSFEEAREVEFDDSCARRPRMVDRLLERLRGAPIAEEVAVLFSRYSQPRHRR